VSFFRPASFSRAAASVPDTAKQAVAARHAVVMLVLHGLAGICIVVGAFRERESEFQVEGAKAFLAVLIPMATLVMVLPNYLVSAPGPYYSPPQLAFVSVVCLGLNIAFLFV
jgi:Ca2+:H+ antiporter